MTTPDPATLREALERTAGLYPNPTQFLTIEDAARRWLDLIEGRRLFWVQNADPGGDLGDYKGYLQESWDESIDIAQTLVEDWRADGVDDEGIEVLELVVVRSEIVKPPVESEDDEP